MSSGLSEDQKRRIEENKRRALEKRAERSKTNPSLPLKPSSTPSNNGLPVSRFPSSSSSTMSSGQSHLHKPHSSTVPSTFGQSTVFNSLSAACSATKTSKPYQIASSANSFQNSCPQVNKKANSGGSSNSHGVNKTILISPMKMSTGQFYKKECQTVRGRCVLVSCDRFKVDVGFHSQLVEIFKRMNTRAYDGSTKSWSFSLDEHDDLLKQVGELSPEVEVSPMPPIVSSVLSSKSKAKPPPEPPDLSVVDKELMDTLMPFQQEGVVMAIQRKGRILIADDMGLGKTLQALCIARYYRQEWPLLIVSPSSVRFDWAQQIVKWLPSIPPGEINVVDSGKNDPTQGLVNVMSYDLLAKQQVVLQKKNFQVIIMDESHFLKNSKAVRTKAALPLLKKSKRVILLSGTPALSRPMELFSQIIAIKPNFYNFHDFGLRYCNAKQLPWGWDYSGSSNMEELQIILSHLVMIRRQKKEVLSQLPSKTRQVVVLDPHRVKIHKSLKHFSGAMSKQSLKGMERQGVLLQYFNETCKAKLSAVRDYVLDFIEADRKFLVFAHHREMLDCIEDSIKTKASDVKYIRIDGSTGSEKRNYFCRKFQTCPEYQVAILSITAANAGLNLSAASTVLFAELFWNPGILVQAEDRVHRIGQEDAVCIQYLVGRGTADDEIWPMIQGKLDVLSKAGLTKDNFSDADTKRMENSDQQTLLDFFNIPLVEETGEGSREGLANEAEEKLTEDVNGDQTPSKKLFKQKITKKKSEKTDNCCDDKELKNGNKNQKLTPSKRQTDMKNFVSYSPPAKQAKLDTSEDLSDEDDEFLLSEVMAVDSQ